MAKKMKCKKATATGCYYILLKVKRAVERNTTITINDNIVVCRSNPNNINNILQHLIRKYARLKRNKREKWRCTALSKLHIAISIFISVQLIWKLLKKEKEQNMYACARLSVDLMKIEHTRHNTYINDICDRIKITVGFHMKTY